MIRVFTSASQKFGESGEDEAVRHLKANGFSIIERNVPNKFGEIDIVAQKDATTYFFEVKAGRIGGINPTENLHQSKIRKFFISCQHYAMCNNIKEYRAQGIIVMYHAGGVQIEILDLL